MLNTRRLVIHLPMTERARLYSPRQIAIGSLFGGPLAAVYVLKKNFDPLDNESGSKQTLIYGGLFLAVILLSAPFLPDNFPH